jgi:hypothetical protein
MSCGCSVCYDCFRSIFLEQLASAEARHAAAAAAAAKPSVFTADCFAVCPVCAQRLNTDLPPSAVASPNLALNRVLDALADAATADKLSLPRTPLPLDFGAMGKALMVVGRRVVALQDGSALSTDAAYFSNVGRLTVPEGRPRFMRNASYLLSDTVCLHFFSDEFVMVLSPFSCFRTQLEIRAPYSSNGWFDTIIPGHRGSLMLSATVWSSGSVSASTTEARFHGVSRTGHYSNRRFFDLRPLTTLAELPPRATFKEDGNSWSFYYKAATGRLDRPAFVISCSDDPHDAIVLTDVESGSGGFQSAGTPLIRLRREMQYTARHRARDQLYRSRPGADVGEDGDGSGAERSDSPDGSSANSSSSSDSSLASLPSLAAALEQSNEEPSDVSHHAELSESDPDAEPDYNIAGMPAAPRRIGFFRRILRPAASLPAAAALPGRAGAIKINRCYTLGPKALLAVTPTEFFVGVRLPSPRPMFFVFRAPLTNNGWLDTLIDESAPAVDRDLQDGIVGRVFFSGRRHGTIWSSGEFAADNGHDVASFQLRPRRSVNLSALPVHPEDLSADPADNRVVETVTTIEQWTFTVRRSTRSRHVRLMARNITDEDTALEVHGSTGSIVSHGRWRLGPLYRRQAL